LQIIDQQVYINGKVADNPERLQYQYKVQTDGSSINTKILDRLDITEGTRTNVPGQFVYVLTGEAKKELEKLPIVKSIEVIAESKGEWNPDIFPHDVNFKWNRDNFGPIYIPQKNVPISLNTDNLALYERLIVLYEGNDLSIENDKIMINGVEVSEYTPRMDYYWMMGDNRHNSADSRYWGFVPEDHVVGKAEFIWLSLDKNKSLLDGKIRWSRLFSLVK